MKEFKLYYFSSECGGIWETAHVYARNLKEAIKTVANLKYIDESQVFAQ